MWLSRPTQSVYRIAPRIPSIPFPPLRVGRGRPLPPLFRGASCLQLPGCRGCRDHPPPSGHAIGYTSRRRHRAAFAPQRTPFARPAPADDRRSPMTRLPLLASCALMLLAAGAPRQSPAAATGPGATGAPAAPAKPVPPAALVAPAEKVAPAAPAAAPPLPAAPVNLDFEQGELGQMPAGWQMTAASERAGFGADLTDVQPYQGKTCAVVRGISFAPTPGTATLMQSFDAAAYRGQRVRFRAAVRTDDSRAQLWLAVEGPDHRPSFFDNMADRPIASNRWQVYDILGEVAADATRIGIGLTVNGDGRAWIDAGAFAALGPSADAPPRPLSARGLTNLIAFARLLGYVRFFHPSDQAAAADWGSFAAAAVAELD